MDDSRIARKLSAAAWKMLSPSFPTPIPNWIDGRPLPAEAGETFTKSSPADGCPISTAGRSRAADIDRAVAAAAAAFGPWAAPVSYTHLTLPTN